MTHYLIYKITNKLNGKIYIGQHQTDNLDDGYMGSGVAINRAIKKYGIENFSKEVLFDVEDAELMDFIEELIVDEEFVTRPDTYNLKTGGEKHCRYSEEARRRISESLKGKHLSEEHKKKISESELGRVVSEETRKKISEANKGKYHSEEAKRKMSEANKGKHLSEETKRKMSESRKGKPHLSEEGKRKLSEINKGKIISEETRKKLSESHKGKKRNPCSEEARRKMSEANRKRWAERKGAA